MAQKSTSSSCELAESIKTRRNELKLTIEAAAQKAGVGTKTWCRYESGESIRNDKIRGVCKALNWAKLPGIDDSDNITINPDQYKTHDAWSKYLMNTFGQAAAVSFAVGSDILLDSIREDMRELAKKPKGSHIGELGMSLLQDFLPPQFLMEYDYNFLYSFHANVKKLRILAHAGDRLVAHSVLDELSLYLIVEESHSLLDELADLDFGWDDWVFDIFDDMDIISFLYSDQYLSSDNPYHFCHWTEEQFYCE